MITTDKNGQIHKLHQSVIEKIAAGEVIERPTSVLKELLENSLDSGASRIEITIEDAGFSCIKVVDDGMGMGKEDIQRCLKSHATSKITTADDLFSIGTLGFRGEALSSIASVSRLSLTSCNSEEGLGHCISAEGGIISGIAPKQHLRGTTVLCRDLFFNVPARKKFMKSRKAERMALLRTLENLMFSFPSVHFICTAEGRRSFDVPQVNNPKARIAQIAGTEFAKKLIYCSGQSNDMSVDIYISDPQDARTRPRYQNLYVNLRRVDNDSVTYAVKEAFSRFITSNLKASWFSFLDVDPSRVDVNIHPTKQRIKFDNEKDLFSFIFKTVHSSISEKINIQSDLKKESSENIQGPENIISHDSKTKNGTAEYTNIHSYTTSKKGNIIRENMYGAIGSISSQNPVVESAQTSLSFLSLFNKKESIEKELGKQNESGVKLPKHSWNLIPCYQIHKMFILAPIKNGIVIIDQHAAHERILYEEALRDLNLGRNESQRLLFPIIINMSSTEKSIVISSRDYFEMLGFELQDFGGQAIAVSAMPATGFMKSSHIEEAIREIVQNLIEEKDRELLSEPQKRFAASYACGAAIKFGQELKQEEMNSLLNSLFLTENPYICPHGRPTLIRFSLEELSRRFLR